MPSVPGPAERFAWMEGCGDDPLRPPFLQHLPGHRPQVWTSVQHRGEYLYNIPIGATQDFFLSEIFKIMVFCAKILVRHCYVLHGHNDWLFGFDQCLWNAFLSHGKWGKTIDNMKPCRFGQFLIQLCEKKLFLGFVQKYYCPELLPRGILVQGLFRVLLVQGLF